MILYLIGLICSIWCVLDIFKKNIQLPGKLIVSLVVLATSWVGLVLYYFWARTKVESWFK